MDYVALGKNIRKYRKAQGLLQKDLALMTNYSDSYIGQLENNKTTPSLEAVVAIANALNVTFDMLLVKDSKFPEKIYLKDVSDRIEKLSLDKKLVVCDTIISLLDSFEKYDSLK